MILTFAWLALLAVAALFCWRRLATYLHILQQEEYAVPRFLRWLWRHGAVDRLASAGLVLLALAALYAPALPWATLVAAVWLGWRTWREPDPTRRAKKKLVITARAARLRWVGFVLMLVLLVLLAHSLWGVVLLIQALPLVLVAAVGLLWPLEQALQRRFWNEAAARLQALDMMVIGITGSFGKTTVKHILGPVLEAVAPAAYTPGSVNTPMGIARFVRERLPAGTRFFVAEMGAYGPGAIARLCRLTQPRLGLVTALGPEHFERFRTMEAIAATHAELVDAVLANGGRVVMLTDALRYPPLRDRQAAQPERFVLVGDDGAATVRYRDVRSVATGITLRIEEQDNTVTELTAPLFGVHQAQNVALAFAAARALQVPQPAIAAALRALPAQAPHRLERKPQPNGALLLDDSYNSNPAGFRAALDLLAAEARPGGRRILVTPGMVELGAIHDSAHAEIGAYAATRTDQVVVIRADRIPSFVAACQQAGGEVLCVASFAEAQAWLADTLRPADVVLLENDLPDLYEARWRL